MGVMKKILKLILIVLACIVAAFFALLAVLTITEYRPDEREAIEIIGEAPKPAVKRGETIRFLTWNVGYGALGSNADFFMDGGSHVRTADRKRVVQNVMNMLDELQEQQADITFLQEVDVSSARSHRISELALFSNPETQDVYRPGQSTYATNYRSLFIPYPMPPIGKVDAGILTLSDYQISESMRVQLPCPFSWPLRLGNLKRCLMVDRIPVEDSDKELVVVNLHLEAYDDGEGKAAQTEMLAELLKEEYQKGNYVIAGGDFNQTFSNVDSSMYPAQDGKWQAGLIDVDAFSDSFQAVMDNRVPSCRSLDQPYDGADREGFQYYLIDGFLVSDNVEIQTYQTQELGFASTDHNPVVMDVKLK